MTRLGVLFLLSIAFPLAQGEKVSLLGPVEVKGNIDSTTPPRSSVEVSVGGSSPPHVEVEVEVGPWEVSRSFDPPPEILAPFEVPSLRPEGVVHLSDLHPTLPPLPIDLPSIDGDSEGPPPSSQSFTQPSSLEPPAWGIALGAAIALATTLALRPESWLRVLPALRLYTRLERSEVLEHPLRRALFERVQREPGIPLRVLIEESGAGRSTVVHHLRVLERADLLRIRRAGRRSVVLPCGSRVEPLAAGVLAHPTAKAVARVVLEEPGLDETGVARRLGLSRSLASWHLARLRVAGVVEKKKEGKIVRLFPSEGALRASHLLS